MLSEGFALSETFAGGKQKLSINISNIPQGVYYLSLSDKMQKLGCKVIKGE